MDARLEQVDYYTRFGKWDLFERGLLPFPWSLDPCRMRILIVVDGTISFSHAVFGLSAVLDTLRVNPEFFVKFDITKAHRQVDLFKPDPGVDPEERYTPQYEGFRFVGAGMPSGFDLYDFDQLWFFGFYLSGHPGALSDAELELIARWMDDGGGVLAMGDHEELGAALGSRIPRVRSMRRWTNAQGVPPVDGLTRHDTLLAGHNSQVTFDDESDDIPQRITPRYYPVPSFVFQNHARPHPILCGADGVIDILPDHPHEGDIIDEASINLGATFSFGSYSNVAEYPSSGATQPAPEVIAWGDVQPYHTFEIDINKRAANPKRFGVIGAYNGHDAGVGRVVVDSTWHHWFDVNLTGRAIQDLDSDPHSIWNPKVYGFHGSPEGQIAYARIQNYFRNVAIWLAPPSQQSCMALRAMWGMIQRYPAIERLSPRQKIWELGGAGIDALGRRASQCTVSDWIHDFFIERVAEEQFKPGPEPCLTCPPFELLERYAVGGMTRHLLSLAYDLEAREDPGDEAALEDLVHEAMRAGLSEGWSEFIADYQRSLESSTERLDALSRLSPRLRLREKSGDGEQST